MEMRNALENKFKEKYYMKPNENDIVSNWNKLLEVIETHFSGDRKEKILELHTQFEDAMSIAPASLKEYFHNAFPGGYVMHVLNVITCSLALKDVWKLVGCNIDFTDEELVFSALFHDLGKIGDINAEYYVPQEDQWRRNKLEELYTINPKLDYMNVSDRTILLLMRANIVCSNKEFLAIKLADGLYNEANKSYLISYSKDFSLKTNLPYIIHAADFMAMHSEQDAWKKSLEENELSVKQKDTSVKKEKQYVRKQTLVEESKTIMKPEDFSKMFDDVFGSDAEKGEK